MADFGISAEGTTSRAQSTVGRRGTTGYRSPEIVKEDNATFTNKVDIFAFGCILYEMVFRKKLFCTDYSLVAYAYTGKLPLSIATNTDKLDDLTRAEMDRSRCIIDSTLQLDPSSRPKARHLRSACAAATLWHIHDRSMENKGMSLNDNIIPSILSGSHDMPCGLEPIYRINH